jgi:hypothetical protein
MDNEELLNLMKAQNDAYLSAYNAGYNKGFEDACRQALEILNKPKRGYKKQEKTDE